METALNKPTASSKPKPTPKSTIHQKFGNKACYTVEEVLEESPTNGCPGLAIPQKAPCLFRCRLQLPEFSVVSHPCKKKKEAEQSAALLAIQKLGIDSQKSSLTESEAADELISRLSYIFSNEFLSSLHPLSNHLKAISYREGELNGLVPVSVLFACDAKLGNLCRSINARVESNPFLSIPLIMRAAAKLSELLVISEKDFWIRRKYPYPSEVVSALGNQQLGIKGALTEAVYIPYSLETDVRTIKMNLYVDSYYLDVIAKELGVVNASKVLISRTIGKASSESRLYFSALEAHNLDLFSVHHNSKELFFTDSTFNIRASYLLGHHVYGNAILASTGYTWRGADLFNEDVSLRSYFRMFIAKTPDGLSKLYRDALLVADLPRQFTTKTNWRGYLPRDLLLAFCRQHRLSEPVITVVCKTIESDQDRPGSCQALSDIMPSLGATSKTASVVENGCLNIVAKESYGCEIKLFSKDYNLILEHTPVEHFMKQGDAVQSATLRVLSFLNLYLKQPNMSIKELSSLSVDFDINCHSTCFLKEFSVSQLMDKVQQSRSLLKEHNLKANHIDTLTYWTSLQTKELNIEGIACGSSPSSGFLVSISYSVLLVSEGKEVAEILEKNDDFEFEIGTGAVITCIEAAVLQMTAGQSLHFYMDMPQKELVLAAAMNCERVISLLSSKPCCLEYSITLLRVTEPFEDRMEQALFSPPLSKQRVEFALQYIKELSATSLIDFGCGSGSLLESLVDTPSSLEKVVGVDLSQKGLIRAAKVLNSKLKLESMIPKSKIKSVILYEGSITEFDSRLSGFDIGSCLEVIEHMEEDQACLFGDIALGLFCPRVLIVSTPNYEYNVILQKSNLASQDEDPDEKAQLQLCKFRNHDHKFEWTREQFNHWATCLALKYGYSVEFGGVGGKDGVEPGFASQIAVFRKDQQPAKVPALSMLTPAHYKTLWEWDVTSANVMSES